MNNAESAFDLWGFLLYGMATVFILHEKNNPVQKENSYLNPTSFSC